MSIDTSFLKNLTPPLRQAVLITGGCFVIFCALIFLAILPTRTRLYAVQTEIANLNATYDNMKTDIDGIAQQRSKTADKTTERDAFLASGVLEPLLGSFAMRGKALSIPLPSRPASPSAASKRTVSLSSRFPARPLSNCMAASRSNSPAKGLIHRSPPLFPSPKPPCRWPHSPASSSSANRKRRKTTRR